MVMLQTIETRIIIVLIHLFFLNKIGAQSSWTTFKLSTSELPAPQITTVAPDNSGNIWVGTSSGLFKFNNNSWNSVETPYEPGKSVNAVKVDPMGNVLVGFWGGEGLYVYDGINWTSRNGGRGFFVITVIEVDRNDIKWVGSGPFDGGTGLGKFLEDTVVVYSEWDSELPKNDIRAIAFDKKNNVWVASWHGSGLGLTKFNHKRWKTFTTSNSELPSNNITAILVDRKGALWLGTQDKGIGKLEGKKWSNFVSLNLQSPHNHVNVLREDEQGNIWVGTCGGGIIKLSGEEWAFFSTNNSELPNDTINALEFDKLGNVWIGTPAGLTKYAQ